MSAVAPPFRASVRRRIVRSILLRAFERYGATRPKGSVALSHTYRRADGGEEPPDVTEHTARLWVASPERWRYEVEMPGGVGVNVVDGARMWSYAPGMQPWSNESDPIRFPAPTEHPERMSFHPEELLAGVAVASRRREARDGHEVEIVEAAPGTGHAAFPPGADAYEIVIDREREIVPRYAARLEGVEFFSVSLGSLEFGVPLPDALFRIDLPDGVTFGPPPFSRPPALIDRLRRMLRPHPRG